MINVTNTTVLVHDCSSPVFFDTSFEFSMLPSVFSNVFVYSRIIDTPTAVCYPFENNNADSFTTSGGR